MEGGQDETAPPTAPPVVGAQGAAKARAKAPNIHHVDAADLGSLDDLGFLVGFQEPAAPSSKPAPVEETAERHMVPPSFDVSAASAAAARPPAERVAPRRGASSERLRQHTGGPRRPTLSPGLPDAAKVRELERHITQMEGDRKKLEEETDKAKKRLGQMNAETVSFRKRLQGDVSRARMGGREDVFKVLLPIIDNLERGVAQAPGGESKHPDAQQVIDGVRLVVQDIWQKLASLGLKAMEVVGEPFDPTFHEAFRQVQTGTVPPNTVVSCHRRGYLVNDRLLRAALVEVEGPAR